MKVSAPAKIILFGEHFVVYENPAILAAINRRINIDIKINKKVKKIDINSNLINKSKSSFNLTGNSTYEKNENFDPVINILRVFLDKNPRLDFGLKINIDSQIPVGIGLGSSAALCVAVSGAINSLFDNYNIELILDQSIKAERFIHSNSSGADCVVSANGGLILYQKNKGYQEIKIKEPLCFVIINSRIKHSTWDMVQKVKEFRSSNISEFNKIINEAREICENGVIALRKGNYEKIGHLMERNQILLEKIGVSNNILNKIIRNCRKEGTLGTKLTGAGGGGSIINLIKKEDRNKFVRKMSEYSYEIVPVEIDTEGMKYIKT
ncbi:MAG: mevalonate kinase [Nitrososphaeraceae archaeon]